MGEDCEAHEIAEKNIGKWTKYWKTELNTWS